MYVETCMSKQRLLSLMLGIMAIFAVQSSEAAIIKPLATQGEDWRAQAPAQVGRVHLDDSGNGLVVVLESTNSALAQTYIASYGETLVIDIINTQLILPEGESFRQENPSAGIALVTVTPLDANSIRMRIVGVEQPPMAEVRSEAGRLVVNATPIEAAQRPEVGAPGASEPESSVADDPIEESVEDAIEAGGVLRIVVTAEKTPEEAQDVPISLTVLTEEELEDADVTSFDDIAANTPNFSTFSFGENRSFLSYSIRGLGNATGFGRDAVAFYIDDVPYDGGQFLDIDLVDLERVEVLRGPQSTLYGRNSIAGVVNVITREPTNSFEANGTTSYGNFEDLDLRASISGPIIRDRLFYRLSGGYGSRDGYTDNIFLDDDIDDQSGGNGRAKLRWTPSERWDVSLNASFDSYRDGGSPTAFLGDEPFEVEENLNGFF